MMEVRGVTAIILAAGVGKRLQGWDFPKSLLPFSGHSLLERHLRALRSLGVEDIRITGGYQVEALTEELRRIEDHAHIVVNDRYARGSMLSLQVHRELLRSGKTVVLMDADVLCAPEILQTLIQSEHANTLLVDMGSVDDEAVKLCFLGGVIVDFHKRPEHAYDKCGESVGFFKFSPPVAAALADRCDRYLAEGMLDLEYEAPLRDLMLERPDLFGTEDITGMPWVEIDFDDDRDRANRDVLPKLEALA
jgi:choline kinase